MEQITTTPKIIEYIPATPPPEVPSPPPEIEHDELRVTERSAHTTTNAAVEKDSNTRQLVPALKGALKRLGFDRQGWKLELRTIGHMSVFNFDRSKKSRNRLVDQSQVQKRVLREMGAHALSVVNPFQPRARIIDTTGIKML